MAYDTKRVHAAPRSVALEYVKSALLIRAEFGTCQLGGSHPRSTRKPYPFWATDNPL